MMNPKMKGLFKGLRYISQIFEDEKEEEIQIGLPTDVKHVAHIGSDGPSNETPSWMKEFKDAKEDDTDSKKGMKTADSTGKDNQEVLKPSRRRYSSESNSTGDSSPKKKDPSSKTKPSRRSKESSSSTTTEGSNRSRQPKAESGSTQGNPPDVPKKSRRKKSKESVTGNSGSSRSRSRATGNASADDDSVKNDEE